MVLALTSPDGPAGARVELTIPNAAGSRVAVLADVVLTPTDWGAQAAWGINASTGNDSGPGTPALPLATMAELGKRLSGQLIQQPTTVAIVGNVVDAPFLIAGTRFAPAGSLVFSGARTVLVSGITISVVTPLGAGVAPTPYPWQITTAGVDWTLQPVGAQIRFSNASVSPIIQVIDANNVVVSPATAAAAPSTPTVALTATVEAIPSILPPNVQAVQCSTGSTIFTALGFTDLSWNSGTAGMISGVGTLLTFCEFKVVSAEWNCNAFVRAIGCRWTIATGATFRVRSAPTQFLCNVCSFVGDAGASPLVSAQGGQVQLVTVTFQNARLQVVDQAYCQWGSNGLHLRNVSSAPLTIDGNSTLYGTNTNAPINGGGGGIGGTNVGVAITINSGKLLFTGAASKPTMTATAGSDVRLGNGGALLTYAGIAAGGTTDQTVNGVPPALTSTTLVRAAIATFGQLA